MLSIGWMERELVSVLSPHTVVIFFMAKFRYFSTKKLGEKNPNVNLTKFGFFFFVKFCQNWLNQSGTSKEMTAYPT
jgi:hypothetical protein